MFEKIAQIIEGVAGDGFTGQDFHIGISLIKKSG